MKPYDDENMTFDEARGRYVLTEQALLNEGIDVRSRIADNPSISPENILSGFLKRASDMIYHYIHGFNADNARQDRLIATVPLLRRVIQEAMTAQAIYITQVGDLTLSQDEKERAAAIDITARNVLETKIPELGCSILYSGGYHVY